MADSLDQKPGCLGQLLRLVQDLFSGESTPADGPWPFARKRWLLSKAEFSFFRVLQQACGDLFVICPKIGLGDLLSIKKGTDNYRSWRNKIDRKHIDFVLCDPKTMQVVAAIELDDASHNTAKAQERDRAKDKACKDAGLPLLRFKAKRSYDVNQVAEVLAELGESHHL